MNPKNTKNPLQGIDRLIVKLKELIEVAGSTGGGSLPVGASLEAKQDVQIAIANGANAILNNIESQTIGLATETTLEAARVLLASLESKDFSTEATLANFNSYMQAVMPTISTESKQDDVIAELQTLVVNTNDSFNSAQHTISSGGGTITGAGNVPAGFKTVVIKRQSGTIVVNGGLTLNNAFRAITFNATESDRVDTTLPAINITGTGTWQWIALDNVEV